MAPPPPPSVNLLRALRALTVLRPVIPTRTRRSLQYKLSPNQTSATARQHAFHRNLHLPRAIHTYRTPFTTSLPTTTPLKARTTTTSTITPILPSPHLLARRFHPTPRLPLPTPSQPISPQSKPESLLANAPSGPPASSPHDRGPPSTEPTQTNFSTMDILSSTPPPTSAIDACTPTGFHLNNGIKIRNGGVMIVNGEALVWKPWGNIGRNLLNARAQWDAGAGGDDSLLPWGMLDVIYPKPDLLILGVGGKMCEVAPGTRARLGAMGVRVDVLDTRNAAAQFNLLATERGVGSVAAAMVPVGWVEGRGVVG